MIPGLGGMNPKQMSQMMRQMGIKTDELKAIRVIIEKEDGKLVIENPSVTQIDMQGQKSFQISGNVREEAAAASEDDVKMVMESANCTKEEAEGALKEANGDIAEAIMKLKKE
jgi:nascent polypeptide-associated complex subunit alpha